MATEGAESDALDLGCMNPSLIYHLLGTGNVWFFLELFSLEKKDEQSPIKVITPHIRMLKK